MFERSTKMSFRHWTRAGVLWFVVFAFVFSPASVGVKADEGDGGFRHVFVIMMENTGFDALIGNPNAPFTNYLAATAGLATNYFGVTHPSQPNYIAATSGSTNGVPNDNDITINVRNIVDQLESHNKTWKAYMQSLSLCNGNVLAHACGNQLYERKHNPFISYQDVQSSPARLDNIVDFSIFATDLANDNVPDYSWISPDQCNDMHGVSPSNAAALGFPTCGYPNSGLDHGAIRLRDVFLQETVGKIMNSSAWKKNSIILIVWDEDDYGGYPTGCCGSPTGKPGTLGATLGGALTPAIVIRSNDPAHRQSNHPYNHYSLLGHHPTGLEPRLSRQDLQFRRLRPDAGSVRRVTPCPILSMGARFSLRLPIEFRRGEAFQIQA